MRSGPKSRSWNPVSVVFLSLGVLAAWRFVPFAGETAALSAGPATRLRLLVPAYFYPGGKGLREWDKLLASPARSDIVAIVNPASGAGRTADPNYTAILGRIARAGVTPIGYITTSYAKRPLPEVKADVDRWLRLYPGIRGIFFDEQASDEAHVNYQADLYRYVRKEKALKLVVTNPGTVCAQGYLTRPAADAVCLFEGPWASGCLDFPSWTARLAPGRTAALPYKVSSSSRMRACLSAAVAHRVGYLYMTDAEGANPWERLPSAFDDEAAAVNEWNRKTER